jgi:hypothetical protein
MKQQINEIKRMQQLAGLIKESQLNEDTDVTYGREEGENSVDVAVAINFIKQTLENRGYNVPNEVLEHMYENGAIGDLFSTEDPSYPQLDYYETFNEEKAMEMAREYVDMMINNGDLDAESIEDFKQ